MQWMQAEPLVTTQESRAPSAGFAPLSGTARYALMPLALSGAGIALYLLWLWFAHRGLPAGCGQGSGCAEVLNSRWSQVVGLPVSGLALAVYLGVLAVLFALGLAKTDRQRQWRSGVLVILATILRVGRRIFLRRRPRLAPQPGTIWLTWGPRLASFLWVLLLGGIAVFLAASDDDIFPTPDWFRWFVALNWVTGIAVLLSLVAVVSALRIWRREELRWITKMKFSFVGLACVILSWFAVNWNILGTSHRM